MGNFHIEQRVTRALGRWLNRWGVDALQYHWLLQASLQMDFRVKNPKSATKEAMATKSRFGFMILMNLVASAVFAFTFLKLGARTVTFTAASLGLGMLVIASTTVVEFARVVIAPDDFLILAHRPVSARTFYAVKLSNLLFYMFVSSLSLFLIPAFLGIRCPDSRWYYPLSFLPVASLSSVLIIGFIVSIYGIVFRLGGYKKSLNMILVLQACLTFIVFSIYHLFPWFVGPGVGAIRDANILNLWNSWARFFPSFWFSGMMELFLGHTSRLAAVLAAIAGGGLILVLPGLFRSISLNYSSHLHQVTFSNGPFGITPFRKIREGMAKGLNRLILKDREEQAFFYFVLSMLRHNLLLKLQFYPVTGIIAAMFAPPLLTKSTIINPFMQADFGRAAMLSITSFLFGIAGLAVLLPYSNEYEAGWLFQIAPIIRPAAVLKALKKAIILLLLIPVFFLNLLFFSLYWPFFDALKMSVFGLLIGLVILQITLLRFRGFPFSRKIERVTLNRFVVTFLTMMGLPFILVYLPSPFAGNSARFSFVLCALFVLFVLLGWVNDRIYTRCQTRAPALPQMQAPLAGEPSR